jgi:hypothetical protein
MEMTSPDEGIFFARSLLTVPLGAAAGLILFTYFLARTVYRLYFHPLANIPGPKIAAATGLYEIWHDAIRGGQYSFVIRSMHDRYGKVMSRTLYGL